MIETFPPRPVHDVVVERRRTSDCGGFAIFTLDVRPAHRPGVELLLAPDVVIRYGGVPDDPMPFDDFTGCLRALVEGFAAELAARPELVPAAELVLRRVVIHIVDSGPYSFRTGGKLAAQAVLSRLTDADIAGGPS